MAKDAGKDLGYHWRRSLGIYDAPDHEGPPGNADTTTDGMGGTGAPQSSRAEGTRKVQVEEVVGGDHACTAAPVPPSPDGGRYCVGAGQQHPRRARQGDRLSRQRDRLRQAARRRSRCRSARRTRLATRPASRRRSRARAAEREYATNADTVWTSVSTAETYSHVSFWTAVSSGTFTRLSSALTASKTVAIGDTFTIPSGSLTMALTHSRRLMDKPTLKKPSVKQAAAGVGALVLVAAGIGRRCDRDRATGLLGPVGRSVTELAVRRDGDCDGRRSTRSRFRVTRSA